MSVRGRRSNVFTIPPGLPFLKTLAERLCDGSLTPDFRYDPADPLPLAGVIDLDAEKSRLGKEMVAIDSDIAVIDRKLDNPQFLAKAAEDVVEEQRTRRADAVDRRQRIEAALARLN